MEALPLVLTQASLLQALCLLADLAKGRGFQQQPLWHTDEDVAMAASSAGSYLIDLLQLRVAHLSPLAITAPEAFLQACSGTSSFAHQPPLLTLQPVLNPP